MSKWNTYPRVVHWIHPSHILTYTRGFTSAAVDATHLAHCEYPTVSCCVAFRESSRDEKWYHSSILLLIIVCAAALWRALFPVLTRAAAIDWMVSCNILLFYLLFNAIFVSISPFLTKLCRFYYGKVGGSPAVYAPIERWCSPIIIKLKKNALLRKKKNMKEIGCQLLLLLLGSTIFETMLVILLCSFYRCLRLPIQCGGEAMSLQSPVIWL